MNMKIAGECPITPRKTESKGYIKGNVRVISYRANAIKRDATLGELEALVRYLRSALCE